MTMKAAYDSFVTRPAVLEFLGKLGPSRVIAVTICEIPPSGPMYTVWYWEEE